MALSVRLLPVYGLAESTVALTIPPLGREFLVDYVDRKISKKIVSAITTRKDKNALCFCGLRCRL